MNVCPSGNRFPNTIIPFAKVSIFLFLYLDLNQAMMKKKREIISLCLFAPLTFFSITSSLWTDLVSGQALMLASQQTGCRGQEDISPTSDFFLWPRPPQATCRCHRLNCVMRKWYEAWTPPPGRTEQSSAVLCCVEWWDPVGPLGAGSPWRLMMRGAHFPSGGGKNGWPLSLKLLSWMICPSFVFPWSSSCPSC